MRSIITCLALLFSIARIHADSTNRNGDVFELRLSGAAIEYLQEFQNLAVVVVDGAVNVPIIGRVSATGLTTSQLAAAIEAKFRAEKIFTNPIVALSAVQTAVNQRTIILGGAVRGPGKQAWSGELTLTSAISLAGGPSEWATDGVKIIRGGKSERFSRKAIRKNPSLDPKIQPNDVIEVEGDF